MRISRKIHTLFYEHQQQVQEDEYRAYLMGNAFELYKSNKLHAGIYLGFDNARGNILVRFKRDKTPRRKMLFTCFSVSKEFDSPNRWEELSYRQLRESALQGIVSDAQSIFYTHYKDKDWIIVGFSRVDLRLVEKLKIGNIVIVAEHEPPWEYLEALKDLSVRLPSVDSVMDISFEKDRWSPVSLSSENQIPETIIEAVDATGEVIIQGPPGTGKTYLMAQLCAHYLDNHQSVVVTALTNRALMELADNEDRDFLNPYLASGRVYKTSLAGDEQRENPCLQSLVDLIPISGCLFLSSYYVLSKYARRFPNQPIFDVLIIEEASQAFLGTIAIFKKMARKLIIVGDPNQLPPIWDKRFNNYTREMRAIAFGLESYAYNADVPSFRLSETHRLPHRAARLTGIFYENSLRSVSKNQAPFELTIPPSIFGHVNQYGGVSFLFLDINGEGKQPKSILDLLTRILVDFEVLNPRKKIAFFSPFRTTNSMLQAQLYPEARDLRNIEVEVVDRIQGMTTDFAILLIPFEGMNFSFDLNRFNVATSRSKTYTLVISDKTFLEIPPTQNELVASFIEEAQKPD